MTPADVRTGKPKAEGRYVVFIRCAASQARDWVEPVIMTWSGDKWHTTYFQNKVIGWIGPLPVMKVEEIAAPEPMAFDL